MQTLRCDILILGSGPAGLAAALAAASCGKQVVILDDNPRPGGQIWREGPQVQLPALARRYREAVAAEKNITSLNGARLIARPSAHRVLFETADDSGVVEWQKLILCCGARELAAFPRLDAARRHRRRGLQAQIKHGLTLRGQKVVIAGSGPLLLAVAATVKKAEVKYDRLLSRPRSAPYCVLAAACGVGRKNFASWPPSPRDAISAVVR